MKRPSTRITSCPIGSTWKAGATRSRSPVSRVSRSSSSQQPVVGPLYDIRSTGGCAAHRRRRVSRRRRRRCPGRMKSPLSRRWFPPCPRVPAAATMPRCAGRASCSMAAGGRKAPQPHCARTVAPVARWTYRTGSFQGDEEEYPLLPASLPVGAARRRQRRESALAARLTRPADHDFLADLG